MLPNTGRLLLVASLLLALGPSASASGPKPTPKQIAKWVEQLGDDDFKVRESASQRLWQAGDAAETALETAVKSGDREVARRARELLGRFHWGIYPDTPDDVVALIRAYQSSNGHARLEVLQKLLVSGEHGWRAVLKISSVEKDQSKRKDLGDLVAQKLPAAFRLAAIEGKYEHFERLLELGHEGQFVENNQYAAYWLLRGRLGERIAHFQARPREHAENKWFAETLAYLHRANGDLIAARKAAEKSDRAELVEGILYELGDWKGLAERQDIVEARSPAERWAYRAAFARLAGDREKFENAVRELRKFALDGKGKNQSGSSLATVAAKGLLLNDRPADGLELLRTVPDRRELLFDILCARLDFAAAIDLAKKETPPDKEVSDLNLAHARLLCLLGEKEGEALFDRYAERIKDRTDPEWVQRLLKEEMRAGLTDRAFAHAAKALSVAPRNQIDLGKEERKQFYLLQSAPKQYLGPIFPQQTRTAAVWWAVLRREFKDESPTALLKRLRDLLQGKVAATDVRKWIEQAEKGNWLAGDGISSSIPLEEIQARALALAEVADLVGLDDLACSLLKKDGSRDALVRLGDRLAAKKQWAEAADSYQQAWKKELSKGQEQHDPLPLYLAGEALVRAGRENEGKKLVEQAHWLPFANARTRYGFLQALTARGHKEASRREMELLLRVSEPHTFYSGEAARRSAFAALAGKDYRKAAEGFEQSMLRCINSGITFVDNGAFANVPAQIHQLRASALLTADKLDDALKHVELALANSPGYADLPIALVPELERRGHKKEATDLFNRCYGAYETVYRSYPRCAWAHNSAAWMSACCRRNLDAALQHAEKAVELAPNRAGYFDTLAEVHFQRGDKDQAIALQKRAIELAPKKEYYRKQLKRLQGGDPSSERPAENEG